MNYIRPLEFSCCSLSARLLKGGRLGPGFGSRLYFHAQAGEGLSGLALRAPGGVVYPLFGESPRAQDSQLAGLAEFATRKITAAIGLEDDVRRLERAAGITSAAGNDYRLMRLDKPRQGGAASRVFFQQREFKIRPPQSSDMIALLRLQEAYEREEVLVHLHRFDPRVCKAGVKRSLEEEVMLCAQLDGRLVGKAQTNARGFAWDQLGGIYVEPLYRGRGLGRALVGELCAALGAQGRSLCLFVKKGNQAALGLYLSLGFEEAGSFRISYYS